MKKHITIMSSSHIGLILLLSELFKGPLVLVVSKNFFYQPLIFILAKLCAIFDRKTQVSINLILLGCNLQIQIAETPINIYQNQSFHFPNSLCSYFLETLCALKVEK